MLRCLLQVMGSGGGWFFLSQVLRTGCFGCFPFLFEGVLLVDPNSFIVCKCLFSCLSCFWLYILMNGVFAVTPVILIWQRCWRVYESMFGAGWLLSWATLSMLPSWAGWRPSQFILVQEAVRKNRMKALEAWDFSKTVTWMKLNKVIQDWMHGFSRRQAAFQPLLPWSKPQLNYWICHSMSTTQRVQILGGLDTIGGLRGHASKGDAAWPKSNICNAVCFVRTGEVYTWSAKSSR